MYIHVPALEGTTTGGYPLASTSMICAAYTFAGLTDRYTEEYLDCWVHVHRRRLVEWFALHLRCSKPHRDTIQRGLDGSCNNPCLS